ncbi:MAG: hypothetical protein KAT70_04375 [Thermoplasmata archaeon]|nr:hypothetical protein [Thermoplasmata archaeon]
MRVSMDKRDPAYHPGNGKYWATLDGVELKHCVTADEERGMAMVYATDEDGRIELSESGVILKEILHGEVKIHPPKRIIFVGIGRLI